MSRIRVLVVDDAVVVRRIVTEALAGVPDIEVVGTASNGRLGLARVVQLNPDVVTMDVEMPDMNGLDALSALRKTHPRLPVIMFSTLTARGAAATLDKPLGRSAVPAIARTPFMRTAGSRGRTITDGGGRLVPGPS